MAWLPGDRRLRLPTIVTMCRRSRASHAAASRRSWYRPADPADVRRALSSACLCALCGLCVRAL